MRLHFELVTVPGHLLLPSKCNALTLTTRLGYDLMLIFWSRIVMAAVHSERGATNALQHLSHHSILWSCAYLVCQVLVFPMFLLSVFFHGLVPTSSARSVLFLPSRATLIPTH